MKTKKEYKRKLLKFKVTVMFVIIGLVLDITMLSISYVIYTKNMNTSFGKICKGVSQVIAGNIDGDSVDDWLNGEDMAGYFFAKQTLFKIRNNISDIENVYLYQMNADGIKAIMDVKTSEHSSGDIGDPFPYDSKWSPFKSSLLSGKNINTIITDNKSGWTMTAVTPILNSYGDCVCYACCDISLVRIAADRNDFMKNLAIRTTSLLTLIVLLAIFYSERRIVHPINRLDVYLRNYALDDSKEKIVNEKLSNLKVYTGKEIDILRNNIMALITDIGGYTRKVSELKDNAVSSIAILANSKNLDNTNCAQMVTAYVQVILDKLRENEKYKSIITDELYSNMLSAVPLYDIGEISVSDNILNKPSKLTDDEYTTVKAHTVDGGQIIGETISNIKNQEYVAVARDMAEYHHERWDGKGYPNGLLGEAIPFSARVLAVADVFNALLSKRTYKDPLSTEKAFDIIKDERGTHFDPEIADAFLSAKAQINEIISKSF